MNFSSIPAYLDPANWQQQSGSTIQNHHHQQQLTSAPPPPVLPPSPVVVPLQPHGGGGAGSIRPGSMADRARMANIPMPETALKCPRCDSANTKFCYFNNYSLSQPRHFCKACKRYWTRGGALRSVPVGGGCRRNKRSNNNNKNSNNNNNNNSSKSPASSTSTDGRQGTNNSGSSTTISSHSNSFSGPASATSLLGLMSPQIPPLRFMSPLGQFSSDHHHHHHFTPSNHMNLNFSTSSCGNILGGTTEGMMVNNNNNMLGVGAGAGVGAGVGVGGHVASLLSSGNLEHWKMQQQFPNFLGGFDPSNTPSSYPFQGGVHEAVQYLGGESTSQISRPKISTSMLNQMASVKMEDNNNNSNNNNNNNNNQDQSALSRQLLGIQGNNENWNTSANAWSDLSASFSSSSPSNAL